LSLTTLGESTDAVAFARVLVSDRLAACVNVLPAMTSLYWWKGSIEEDREQQLVIKTTRGPRGRHRGALPRTAPL
jgi:periplasmic divalent cation tolerance protein